MNENITFGNITYTVKSNNPNAAFPKNGFILKATKEGLFFFSSTDPADDTPIIPVVKFEIIKQINLGSSSINGFTLDDKGQVWASLIEGGIFLLE